MGLLESLLYKCVDPPAPHLTDKMLFLSEMKNIPPDVYTLPCPLETAAPPSKSRITPNDNDKGSVMRSSDLRAVVSWRCDGTSEN